MRDEDEALQRFLFFVLATITIIFRPSLPVCSSARLVNDSEK